MDRCFGVSMALKIKRFRLFSTAFLLILTGIIHVSPFKILLLIFLCLVAHRMYPGICEAKCKVLR